MSSILEVKDLNISFKLEEETAKAIHGVNLSLDKGSVLGVVGESGCGKSVSATSILQLLAPNAIIESGEIIFKGQNLLDLNKKQMQKIRGEQIALIPQDPLTSLNPLYTIGDQIIETIMFHQKVSKKEAKEIAIKALKDVRIPEAEKRLDEYPHQFSGGMCQRAIIAMALSCNPELIIADEPTTALDVTVQAQILDLMRNIKETRGTSIIFITHDLGVVSEFCDNVAVMYAGRVVEYAKTEDIFNKPLHPYTQGLLESLPSPDKEVLNVIEGQPPSITDNVTGCPFHPRCKYKMEICDKKFPHEKVQEESHKVCCYLY